MIMKILMLFFLSNIPIWGNTPVNLSFDIGPSLLLGDNIKEAKIGPSAGINFNLMRFPGIDQGIGVSFFEGKCCEDTLYRYIDFYISSTWEMHIKEIYPFLTGILGVSRWWVLKDGKVVTLMWGDKYQATSLLMGGGVGLMVPTKMGKLQFLLKGRFLFSQNQGRFGIKDENEGSIGLSVGYRIKL